MQYGEKPSTGETTFAPTEGESETVPVKEAATGTVVVGTLPLTGTFSPFYATEDIDKAMLSQMIESPLRFNNKNELVNHAGSVNVETIDVEGTSKTKYTVKLNQGMNFSDGEAVTIDDYLFTIYTLADPMYEGPLDKLRKMDIQGLMEYYYDNSNVASFEKNIQKKTDKLLAEAKDDGLKQWMKDSNLAGWWNGELPGNINGEGLTWSDYIAGCGMDIGNLAIDDVNAVFEKLLECEFEYYKEDYMEKYKEELAKGKKREILQASLAEGAEITSISGITRVDDYTCEILVNTPHIEDREVLGLLPIVPSHYYGNGAAEKGNLTKMHEMGYAPMGSGPYTWGGYENYRVTLKANPSYHRGTPVNTELVFQEMNENQMVDAVLNGVVDVVKTQASMEAFEKCDAADNAYYFVSPGTSYQYIGINANNVTDRDLRKGLLSLIDKDSFVSETFGGLKDNLHYPVPATLMEYPEMSENPYPFNKEQALSYFKEAGYKQDKDGKLVKRKEQLVIDLGVAYSERNPLMSLAQRIKEELESIGAVCNLIEYKSEILWDTGDKQIIDMWIGTMTDVTNCNLNNAFEIENNVFGLQDKELQEKLDTVNRSLNAEERKPALLDALTLLMDKAVILPVCQDSEMIVVNTNRVVMEKNNFETMGDYFVWKIK